MNKCLDTCRYDIITDTLRPFKNRAVTSNIIRKVDPELMEHLIICGVTEDMLKNFYSGNMSEQKAAGMYGFLDGCFASFRAYKFVQSLGASNIKREVPCQDTRIDLVATLSKNIVFKTVLPDLQEVFCCQKSGVHVFEVKGTHKLKKKAQEQMKKARGIYKNCHVLVLADTGVSEGKNNAIRNEGADVIRFSSTKRDIVEEILSINKLRYEFAEKLADKYNLKIK